MAAQYPNVINYEEVRGEELPSKWDTNIEPTLPF